MNLTKRLSGILFSAILLVSIFSGCQGNASRESANAAPSSDTSAAGQDASNAAAEPTTLTWYTVAETQRLTGDGFDAAMAEINRYIGEKLNVKLDLRLADYADYDQKCMVVVSSGEPYDLMFTCDWLNSFANNVGRNAYLPLDDLLAQYAPDIVADVPEFAWDAVKVKGQVYAMFARQNWAKNDGYYIRKDAADAIGFTGTSYDNGDFRTLAEVEEIWEQLKEQFPDSYPACVGTSPLWIMIHPTYDLEFLGGDYAIPGVHRFSDSTHKVFNQFESEEFMDYCKMVYRWEEKGYMPPDAATYATQTDIQQLDAKAGKILSYKAGFAAPHVASIAQTYAGWEEPPVPLITSKKYIGTNGVMMSLVAVGVNAKSPEKAVSLYNLVYSDEFLANTFLYGVEGLHYNKVSDNEVECIKESGYEYPIPDWSIGNQFISWVQYGTYDKDIWEITKAFGDDAEPSPLLGFIFDTSSVKNEVANCMAIYNEYKYPLLNGAVNPEEKVPEMIERLKGAGSDRIIEELQAQVDAFLAGKN